MSNTFEYDKIQMENREFKSWMDVSYKLGVRTNIEPCVNDNNDK